MKKLILLILTVSFFGTIFSQTNGVLDKPWIKQHTKLRKVIPYPFVRESDVMWSKRIWRELDLREKINQSFYYPIIPVEDRQSLFEIIKRGVMEGTLTAYAEDDDEFRVPLPKAQAEVKLGDSLTIMTEDEFGDLTIPTTTYAPIEASDIVKYHMKEDWFFDKARSVMDVRIMGIMPLTLAMDENGNVKGLKPVFWIYFPEARYVLVNYDVFNSSNDSERRTFDDIFYKRIFSSVIIKKSNVYDRNIIDVKVGINRLLEADKIKEELFTKEHNLWVY